MKRFSLDMPFDGNLQGIPPQYRSNKAFSHNVQQSDVCWKLFSSAMKRADGELPDEEFCQWFQTWISFGAADFNSLVNLLYMMRPDSYFSLQRENSSFVRRRFGITLSAKTPEAYLAFLEELSEKADEPFWVLSHLADPHLNDDVDATYRNVRPNTILYGPPGTGKTYSTMAYAVAICDERPIDKRTGDVEGLGRDEIEDRYRSLCEEGRIEFVTFHQSYSYEEFIEGIRPKMDASGTDVAYTIEDGVFKRFCKSSKAFDDAWNELCGQIAESVEDRGYLPIDTWDRRHELRLALSQTDLMRVNEAGDKGPYFTYGQCLNVYQGLPGVPGEGSDNYRKAIVRYMEEELDLQPFAPSESASRNRAIVIDEINRGNISRIFGELITLIEEDKRADANGRPLYAAKLPYSKESFSVPSNVYILGTMNTADRSLTQIDTALRRRFEFVEMTARPDLLEDVECDDGTIICLSELLKAVNDRISVLRDREHVIGHSYLMGEGGARLSFDELKRRFSARIIPLLQEYFYDDYASIKKVLGEPDGAPDGTPSFIAKRVGEDLGYASGLVDTGEAAEYSLCDDEGWTPEMFVSIYQSQAVRGRY